MPESRTATGPAHIAIIGAGMAGIACARTLLQAGHRVSVFEKSDAVGGRMATQTSSFGSFDHGAQYFTVRDERFALALQTTPGLCKPWSANAVRVLDAVGQVASAALPNREPHWVPVPGMASLVRQWSLPLVHAHDNEATLTLSTTVTRIERDALDAARWQLRTESAGNAACVHGGFDTVLLAVPAAPAAALLKASKVATKLATQIGKVNVGPC
jgi:renalase